MTINTVCSIFIPNEIYSIIIDYLPNELSYLHKLVNRFWYFYINKKSLEYNYKTNCESCVFWTTRNDDLKLFKYLIHNNKNISINPSLIGSILRNSYSIFIWLIKKDIFIHHDLIRHCLRNKDIRIIQWFYDNNYIAKDILEESLIGDCSIIIYLDKLGYTLSKKWIENIVEYGNLEELKYIQNKYPKEFESNYYLLGSKNDEEMIEYFESIYGKSSDILNQSFRCGEFEFVKWLYEKKQYPTDKDTEGYCFKSKCLKKIRWFFGNNFDINNVLYMEFLFTIENIEFLLQNYNQLNTFNEEAVSEIYLKFITTYKDLEKIKFLYEKWKPIKTDILHYAIIYNCIEMVHWMLDNNFPIDNDTFIYACATNLDIVKRIYERGYFKKEDSLIEALLSNNLDIAEWLLSKDCIIDIYSIVSSLLLHNYFKELEWFYNKVLLNDKTINDFKLMNSIVGNTNNIISILWLRSKGIQWNETIITTILKLKNYELLRWLSKQENHPKISRQVFYENQDETLKKWLQRQDFIEKLFI